MKLSEFYKIEFCYLKLITMDKLHERIKSQLTWLSETRGVGYYHTCKWVEGEEIIKLKEDVDTMYRWALDLMEELDKLKNVKPESHDD